MRRSISWAILLLFLSVNHSYGEHTVNNLRGLDEKHNPHAAITHRLLEEHDSNSCGAKLQRKFNCSEYDCEDRVAGTLNYPDALIHYSYWFLIGHHDLQRLHKLPGFFLL